MQAEQRVRELAEEKLTGRGDLFIVDVKMHPGGRLEILLDGDNGVAIQDCADVSRHVGFYLEEENVIDHAYNLEVSSAGVGSPLKLFRQYRKNEGRTLQVNLLDGSKHEGQLRKAEENGILLEEKVKARTGRKQIAEERFISFDQIKEAKVIISFK
jgi:ribosome maturation factor RimP